MGINDLVRIAWRNCWRERGRSGITIGAMAFAVAMCMGFNCIDDGMFADVYRMMVRERLGHVQVHNPRYPEQRALYESLAIGDALVAEWESKPEVAAVTVRAFAFALVGVGEESSGAQLIGVDPAREEALTGPTADVEQGQWLPPAPAGGIVLGVGLAENLRAQVGDEVVAVTQAADGSLGNELYRVLGIIRTGNPATNRSGAWLHLADLQTLMVLPGQVHELVVLGTDDGAVESLAAGVRAWMGEREALVRTWKEVDPTTSKMLEMQDAATWILLLIVFSVAALGIMNTMLMAVFERTPELGVLHALGLSPRSIVAMVMLETVLLACVAVVVGVVFGLAIDAWLIRVGIDLGRYADGMNFGGMQWDPVLRGAFRWQGVVYTVASVVVVALLASLWPALRAARLRPVEAMREG